MDMKVYGRAKLGNFSWVLAQEMACLIKGKSGEQNLPAHREAHHTRGEVRSWSQYSAPTLSDERRDFTGMKADACREVNLSPRSCTHSILKKQREAHSLGHAGGFGKVTVAHVLK